MFRVIFTVAILGMVCLLPSWGQQATLTEALAGKAAPLALKLKDLDGKWLRFTLEAPGDSWSKTLPMMMMTSGGGASPLLTSLTSSVYYTRGETVAMGNSVFLAAYAVPRKTLTPHEFEAMMDEDWKPDPLTPETSLSLSLLNLRTCGHLIEIQPFDLVRETTVVRRQADINAETDTRLRQLALAVLMYAQDNDEQFPPMQNQQELKTAILDYVGKEKVFIHPETKEAFLHNPKLDRLPAAQVSNPTDTVLWYEANPAQDGTRGVSFADGHAKRMAEEQWQQLKRKAEIP